MSITLSDAQSAIESNGFTSQRSTSKLIEYKSTTNGKLLYLRVAQGFPKHADIAIHPEANASTLSLIADIEAHRNGFRFSSNMSAFPSKVNAGKAPENYGRVFHVSTGLALANFCVEYGGRPWELAVAK